MASIVQRRVWLQGGLIALLTIAAYLPALDNGFVWDDDDYVTRNQTLEDAAGLQRIWLERGAVPQYYPLVHTSFWLERRLWGLNPAGYHATNVALHVLASILLWRVLVRLAVPGALLAALLFAVHPVGVESVAWITERKNVLAAVFFFASTLAWLNTNPFAVPGEPAAPPRARSPKNGPAPAIANSAGDGRGSARTWYAASLLFFIGAMLSKTVSVTLAPSMLLMVWWKTGRIRWGDVRPLVPFFVLGAALAANTVWMERTRVGAVGPDWSFSIAERVLIAGRALWFYAGKLVWPFDLTFIYPRWVIDAGQLGQWLFPIGALALLAFLWLQRSRLGRGPLVAALFFGGTLLPALGFVNVYPMRFSFVADHFQYVASIGVLALIAATLWRDQRLARAGFVLPVFLAALTWRQAHIYKDLETLWTDTIRKNPSAWLAHNNLGTWYLDRGAVQPAIERFREAVRLKPDYYEAHGNLGVALLRTGAIDSARASTDAALRHAPRYTPALINRAALLIRDGEVREAVAILQDVLRSEPENAEALNTLGSALAATGDLPNAQRAFEAAIGFEPGLVSARTNLARVLISQGKDSAAARELDQALRIAPADIDALNLRGLVLMARGQAADAISYFRDLTRSRPDEASAHFHLGTLLSQSGDRAAAVQELETAVRLNPNHAEARNNLGIAHLLAGRYEAAAEQFAAAIRIRRNNPEALNNLAYAQVRLGRRDEAVTNLREALRLRPGYAEALQQLRSLGVPNE